MSNEAKTREEHSFADRVREKAAAYKEGAAEFLDSTSEYIKENPQRSVLIAAATGAAIGLVLGLLLKNRR